MSSPPEIRVYPSPEDLAGSAALRIAEILSQAIHASGFCTMLLSGGSTPRAVYERLAQTASGQGHDWSKVHLFWGDERCVPPDHPDSNYDMARRALLSQVPIPDVNVYRVDAEHGPEQAASHYEADVRAFFSRRAVDGAEMGVFDLVLLGLGEDGHTASLFPRSPALLERQRWFAGVEHDRPPPPLVGRVTATLALINAARQVIFLVVGKNKAEIVRQVLTGDSNPPLPAQLVQPDHGYTLWLLDASAALSLPSDQT